MMLASLFKNNEGKEKPETIEEYEKLFLKKSSWNIPLRQKDFAAIDIESDGLNPKKNHILSIGGVKIIDGKIDVAESIELFVEQKFINNKTVQIHGITKNITKNKINEKEMLLKTVEFLGDAVIIGHNVNFDIAIINRALKKHYGMKLKNSWIDTINLFHRINPKHKSHPSLTLDDLCDEFNISKSDRHTSAGDSFITAIIFLKMIGKLEKRGINTLKDLLRKRRLHI